MTQPTTTKRRPKITADSTIRGDYPQVFIDGARLSLAESIKLVNHSPAGLGWGCGGSGPDQLSLALLLAAGAPPETALNLYQDFKWEVISRLENLDEFTLKGEAVLNWMRQ